MQSPRVDLAQALGRHSDIDASVYRQQIDNLALRRVDILAHVVVAGAAVAFLGRLYPIWASLFWVAGLGLAIWSRVHIHRSYRNASIDRRSDPRWGHLFTFGALATGCGWGLLASAFVVTDDLLLQVLALALIGGMAVGAIARNATSTPVMVALVGPMITMSAGGLLIHPNSFHVAVAIMFAAFGIVLTTSGRSLHQSLNADLRQTFELVKTGTSLANAQDVASIGGWEIEAATRRVVWSGAMFRILGLEAVWEQPSIELMLSQVHPEDRDRVEAALNNWLSGKADLSLDHRLRPIEGNVRWIHQFGLIQQDPDGRPARHIAMVQDITERKQSEENLHFANVVMKLQIEAAQDGILVVSKARRIMSFNERFGELYRIPKSILDVGDYDEISRHVMTVVIDPDAYMKRLQFYYDNPGQDGHDEIEIVGHRILHRYTVTLNGPTGDYLGRAWFLRDVTEQRQALANAVRTSRLDPLTGLVNRRAFVETLRSVIAKAAHGGTTFAVLYVDLDHFKDVNDALGHPAGDELLRMVARRLTANSRPSDTVARLGGDEFAIIADDLDTPDEGPHLAARLIEAVSAPYSVHGVPVRVSASIGIAPHAPGSTDAETLLSQADLALYNAKADGRSDHRSFTAAMDAEARQRSALGAELHDAISEDQLFLVYQPQIDLASGRVVGVEALARWRHPQRGVLGPELFIPIAEQAGVIGKLGNWVISAACRQAKAWQDAGARPIRIAVNISTLQFKTSLAFEAHIDAALEEHGLAADRLELELSETGLLNAFKADADLLSRLRDRGLGLAIDDFGSGYSSIECFRRYPVNRIKIARTLVDDVENGGSDAAIVKATIGLARELGMRVIAKGVERRPQVELLASWGCGEAQGFMFVRPMPEHQIPLLLRKTFSEGAGAAAAFHRAGHSSVAIYGGGRDCACLAG